MGPTLTEKQRALLASLEAGGRFVRGGDVRVAQNLAKRGLIMLDDQGRFRDPFGSERFWAQKNGPR